MDLFHTPREEKPLKSMCSHARAPHSAGIRTAGRLVPSVYESWGNERSQGTVRTSPHLLPAQRQLTSFTPGSHLCTNLLLSRYARAVLS